MLTRTEKGAISHATTKDGRVDLFYKAIRGLTPEQLELFLNASWRESELDTLKLIHFIRDCRGKGKGEKKLCFDSYQWLIKHHPAQVSANFMHLPFYGCYKDWLVCFAGNAQMEGQMLDALATQLQEDWSSIVDAAESTVDSMSKGKGEADSTETPKIKQAKISLAWKWTPTEGCSFDKKFGLVGKLCKRMGTNKKTYRQRSKVARAILNVVEQLMCAKKWEDIVFPTVSSNAMHRYKKCFAKHQTERWAAYLESVKKGEAKMNVGQLMPHEILSGYLKGGCFDTRISQENDVEAQWAAYKAHLDKSVVWTKNTMMVADLSGSMFGGDCLPAKVCMALTLTGAHVMKGRFHGMCMPFSATAKFHQIQGESLRDQLVSLMKVAEVANTNIQAVFDEILKTYILWKVKPEDEIDRLCFITDGQWDTMTNNSSHTNFEAAEKKFKQANRTMPEIIFWNVRAGTVDFPVSSMKKGVALVSGFSADLMKLFVDGEDLSPYTIFRKAIDDVRYDRIVCVPE
jgi:hypothetical protein